MLPAQVRIAREAGSSGTLGVGPLEVEGNDVVGRERADEALDLGLHVLARQLLERLDQLIGRIVQGAVVALDRVLVVLGAVRPLALGAAQLELPVARDRLVPVDRVDEAGGAVGADLEAPAGAGDDGIVSTTGSAWKYTISTALPLGKMIFLTWKSPIAQLVSGAQAVPLRGTEPCDAGDPVGRSRRRRQLPKSAVTNGALMPRASPSRRRLRAGGNCGASRFIR